MDNSITMIRCDEVIRNELDKRLKNNEKFSMIYCDIDNFRIYNEIYGFDDGDKAICTLSDIIIESVKSLGENDDFIAHIGADDFVIITSSTEDEEISKKIIVEFDKRILALYNSIDKDRGYVVSKSRLGEVHTYPIMTLSIAVVSNERRIFSCAPEILTVVNEVKGKAKETQGSVYVKDKRSVSTQYIQ